MALLVSGSFSTLLSLVVVIGWDLHNTRLTDCLTFGSIAIVLLVAASRKRVSATHSIFARILLLTSLAGGLVAVAGITALYFYVYQAVEKQQIDALEVYIRQRGAHEETIFDLAESNHAVARGEIIRRLRAAGSRDPVRRFTELFEKQSDGITRNREVGYDGTRVSGVYVGKDIVIDRDIRQRVLTFYDICNEFGPGWHTRFQDTYITTPENIMVIYWPEVPRWAQNADTTLHMPDEEYVWVADERHNPERKTVWTGLFYDQVGKVWMVSCETPVYEKDRHLATVGHDIVLNELFDRVIHQRLDGTYNLVLREDGRLIAHPELIDEIKQKEGHFNILESGDEHLKMLFQTVKSSRGRDAFVVEHPDGQDFIAVSHMKSIGWYFVTVYPKSVLAEVAAGTAMTAIVVGTTVLLILGGVLFFVLRKYVRTPLNTLTAAAAEVESGNYDTTTALVDRDDEIGQLSHAFNRMVLGIRERDAQLAGAAKELEQRVIERTADLEEATARSENAAQAAEAANQAKSAFLANMSHEIRTPLNAIQGFAQILDQRIQDPQQREYLQSIESSSKSLLALINDILDLARSEEGSLELSIGDVSTLKVFKDLESSFAQKAQEKGLTYTVDLDPGLPQEIRLDGKRLSQVLTNLVDNAVKFTNSGRVVVSARAMDSSAGPGRVDLSFDIQDTGSGIPDDQIDHIFGAFNQRKGQSINEYGGTGLGLALVHRLVDLMGGRISVQSEPDVGSTFQVVIEGVEVVTSATLGDIEILEESGGTVEYVEAWSPADLTDEARSRLPLLVDYMKSQAEICADLSLTLTLNEIDAFAKTMIDHGDGHDYPPLRAWGTRLARQSDAFDMDGVAESLKIYSQLVDATAALTA